MNIIRNIISLFISCIFGIISFSAIGQELNCQVEVNADQVANANKQVFETLKGAINDNQFFH